MFDKILIKTLKSTINEVQEENKNLKYSNEELKHDCMILLDTNRDLRAKCKDLENNIEFLVNNLTPKKRASLGLDNQN